MSQPDKEQILDELEQFIRELIREVLGMELNDE
jgi:hypothetical protein